MNFFGNELKLSISLGEEYCESAAKFNEAGFVSAECDLPVYYFEKVDMSIFEPFLNKVVPTIQEAGLGITSFHLPFGTYWDISSTDEQVRLGAVSANITLIQMLERYEGNKIVIHPSFEPIQEQERSAHIDACKKSLSCLQKVAQQCGKVIALENLPRTCLGRNSDEMLEITERGTLCSLCMDTTHMFHETPQQFIKKCGKWIVNTHLSDYLNGQNECHWVPGTGSLNWREIIQDLVDVEYSGTFNFELARNYAPLEIIGGLSNAISRESLH